MQVRVINDNAKPVHLLSEIAAPTSEKKTIFEMIQSPVIEIAIFCFQRANEQNFSGRFSILQQLFKIQGSIYDKI